MRLEQNQHVRFTHNASPVGDLLLVADVQVDHDGSTRLHALRGIYFASAPHAKNAIANLGRATEDRRVFAEVIAQLESYFSGARTSFDVDLAPRGTAFQQDVWRALAAIPYGTTSTYATIARVIGRPSAIRAVGAANAKNPISIVLPCHRVVGHDGQLTGYAGGMSNKRVLLDLEAASSIRKSRSARGPEAV
jgi:methylated-DNA-[protein]-cysteine S-methyltransferase